MSADRALDSDEEYETQYVESQVIMSTVQVVAPFALTYALFMTFHGASTPGGGFQGGAIMGSVVLMIAFAFGIEPTRRWLQNKVVVGLAAGGTAFFVLVGLGTIALGGAFLEYELYGEALPIFAESGDAISWGMEAIEIGGIALIVSGIIMGLFFATAAGYDGGDRA